MPKKKTVSLEEQPLEAPDTAMPGGEEDTGQMDFPVPQEENGGDSVPARPV